MVIEQRTLKSTCDDIGSYEIDITCLAETNTHQAHPLGESTLRNTINHHWNHSHITTSESESPWKALYKPGRTAIITQKTLCNGFTTSGQDLHGLGRWSYITITGRDQSILSIIFVYLIYDVVIQTAGYITNTKQQWQTLEERDQEHKDTRQKIIIYLSNFITSLTRKHHEVILGIDVNEPNILYNNGVS